MYSDGYITRLSERSRCSLEGSSLPSYKPQYTTFPITTMKSTLYTASIVLGLTSSLASPLFEKRRPDYFGPAVSTGPSQADIIRTSTIIVPGRNPSSKQPGGLYLWPGISNGTGDLIQTTVDSWSGNSCGATGYQWCMEASIFKGYQINGPSVAVNPTDRIKIEYIRGKAQPNGYEWEWLQMVTLADSGKYLSSLKSISGTMRG